MARSKSSRRWLKEHFDDPFVQMAQQQGLRSRAAFKLREIQDKDGLIRPGMTIVDLGAAPGGWTEIAVELAGPSGAVFALDILPMDPVRGAVIVEGDFTEDGPLQELESELAGRPVQLVLSDMAPNISGIAASDQARSMYLAELALDFAKQHLEDGGTFLVKVFQGEGFDPFLSDCRAAFDKVVIRKPKASRPRSREVYLLARGLKPAARP